MDVDLSTDLDALLPLVAPLLSGHSDVAIGTRLARGRPRRARAQARAASRAATTCSCARVLHNRFTDAQCGFKAIAGRRRPRPAAPGRGRRLVLRHRAAGAGRAQRPAHPRGPGRLGRRPGLPGRHRPTRRSTTSRGSGACCRSAAAGRAGRRRTAAADGRRPCRAGPLRRRRRGQHGGLPRLFLALRPALGRLRGQRCGPGRVHGWPTRPPTAGSRSAGVGRCGWRDRRRRRRRPCSTTSLAAHHGGPGRWRTRWLPRSTAGPAGGPGGRPAPWPPWSLRGPAGLDVPPTDRRTVATARSDRGPATHPGST